MRSLLQTVTFLGLAAMTLPVVQSSALADGGTPAAQKEWTVMVYINGANSLSDFGAANINQMEQVGSSADLSVVVQWTQCTKTVTDSTNFEERCGESSTKRLYVQKDTDPQNVTSPILQDLGNKVDMGIPDTLVDFAQWAMTAYPAKHFLLDVWDHGSGWHSMELAFGSRKSRKHVLDISLDETTGHVISTLQLGVAVGKISAIAGQKIDVYASDACLMQMAEIAGEMTDSVQVFAGSEETEPGAGWSYADFLTLLAAKPDASPSEVGTFLEKSYLAAYNGGVYGNESVTFSAIDMSAFPAFEAAVKKLGTALGALNSDDTAKVLTAIGGAQAFTLPDYVDVSDFVAMLQPQHVVTLDDGMMAPLKTALSTMILGGGGTGSLSKAAGLSMWIPNSSDIYNQYVADYQQLKFDQATGWSVALKHLLGSAIK